MPQEKTHYRKAFNSPYLSSADIVDATTLVIKHVRLEPDKTKKTKDKFNTAYFTVAELRQGEPLKPMILNATNSKVMKKLADSPFIDDWTNITISVFVDHNVRMMGEITDGLRIGKPPERKQLQQGTAQWDNAVTAFKRDGNLDAVTLRVDVSPENAKLIESQANNVA